MATDNIIPIEPLSFSDKTDSIIDAINLLINNVGVVDQGVQDLIDAIGLPLSRLNTIEKDNLINAINSFLARGDVDALTIIGDITQLTTPQKANLVDALNSLNTISQNAKTTADSAKTSADTALSKSTDALSKAETALVRSSGSLTGTVGSSYYRIVTNPYGGAVAAFSGSTAGQIQLTIPTFLVAKTVRMVVNVREDDDTQSYDVTFSINSSGVLQTFTYTQFSGTRKADIAVAKRDTSIVVCLGTTVTDWKNPVITLSNIVVTSPSTAGVEEAAWVSEGWTIARSATAVAQILGTLSGRFYKLDSEINSAISVAKTEAIDTAYNSSLALAIALG